MTTRNKGAGQRLLMIDATGIAVVLGLVAAWYALSLEPLREARASRNALLAELQPRREKISALEIQARTHQNTLASVGAQIAEGELQLRNIDQINHRLSELTTIAAEFDLQLEEVKPGSPVAMQWFITMPIKLSGTGEFPQLGAFLHALPNKFPDVAVVGFELRGEPEALEKKPRFVLNLVWYAVPRTANGHN